MDGMPSLYIGATVGKKKKKVTTEFLQSAKTLKIGKVITVPEVHQQYVQPELIAKQRRKSTIGCLARDIDRFAQWWSTISSDRLPIAKIRRKHLEAFRAWVLSQGGSVAMQNAAVRSVIQILNAAAKHELITHAPKLEALQHRGVAPRIFPSDEEIDRLWKAADQMEWPVRDSHQKPLHYSASTAWRVAIVLYRCYGFRTQELVRVERGFRSIAWGNVHGPGITPNPEGRCSCDFGWLSYTPQKQERVKPEPLVVPLNKYTRAALNQVAQGPHKSSDIALDWSLSSVGFYAAWNRLCELASVKPRAASGVKRYTIKHLRKAATTGINNHRAGMAEHIVGHGADRSGQSIISSKHYNNAEEAVLDCVLTMPVPSCFDELL